MRRFGEVGTRQTGSGAHSCRYPVEEIAARKAAATEEVREGTG